MICLTRFIGFNIYSRIIIEYAGKRFLVDPVLGEKGSFAPFPFSNHQELRNPLHDLPVKAEEIVNSIDCVLLTHLQAAKMVQEAQCKYVYNKKYAYSPKEFYSRASSSIGYK